MCGYFQFRRAAKRAEGYSHGVQKLSPESLKRYQAMTDLSDIEHGHAIGIVLEKIKDAVAEWSGLEVVQAPSDIIVPVVDNYDRLYYEPDAVARSTRYSHYVSDTHMLRTHTTAAIPAALDACNSSRVIVSNGLVYRRDVIDRMHVGEPHQVDLWVIKRGSLSRPDLVEMIKVVLQTIMPDCQYRMNETSHPYTVNGLEVEVWMNGRWVEVLECGEARPDLLCDAGLLPEDWSGLAMGIGLDRLVMLLKGIEDIRLLRSSDPRVSKQMKNLLPYEPVSNQPATKRDMSIAVNWMDMEDVGDRVRQALGDDAEWVEDIEVIDIHSYYDLPEQARERLGMAPSQLNVLLRLHLRAATQSIPKETGNLIYDRVYEVLHEGSTEGYKRK